jgi:anaerobic magnesium-protoporphyrin IX monomethyl ester cyclase
MVGQLMLPVAFAGSVRTAMDPAGLLGLPRTDCVLVYPPWTILQGRTFLTNCLPPLGILSIAAYLLEQGFTVKVIDVHAERMTRERFRELVRAYRPRYVGITVLSSMVVSSHAIARLVKSEVPDCVVVMGGVHAEAFPERMLRSSAVDLVVRGDGERPMAAIVAGKPWVTIESVSFLRPDGTVSHTPLQAIELDLDQYPMPAYDLIDFKRYFPSATSYRNLPAINVIMTRGCPGTCTFCNSARTVLRSRTPRNVFEQIQLLRERYGIRQVQFFDDTFTVNKLGALELCRLLREHKVDITFSCYARGDCFSAEMAHALKSAGCHQIMIGVETGSEAIMKNIGKVIRKERYAEVVRIAHRYGIEVRAGFIIGNLGETWNTMEESLQFAIDLDVDFFQLSISTPYPGTELFKRALAEGRLAHQDYKRYGQGEPIVRLDGLTGEQVLAFERRAWRRFYLRPKTFLRQLRRVTNMRHLKDLYHAFSLLIMNRIINPDPDWAGWDRETEEGYYDRAATYRETVRLTHELRKRWVNDPEGPSTRGTHAGVSTGLTP